MGIRASSFTAQGSSSPGGAPSASESLWPPSHRHQEPHLTAWLPAAGSSEQTFLQPHRGPGAPPRAASDTALPLVTFPKHTR